jgi:hypothetical protein
MNHRYTFFVQIKYLYLTLFTSLFFLSQGISQDILMSWDFAGNSGSETTVTALYFAPNVSSTGPSGIISRGSGLNPAGNTNRFNANNWSQAGLVDAVANNDYMEWTITPAPGYQISVSSLVYNWQRSGTGPPNITIRSNQDSYSTNLDTKTGLITTPNNGLTSTITTINNVAAAVTFRIYGYGATSSTGSGGFEGTGSDLVIYGTVSLLQDAESEARDPVTQITGGTIFSTSNSVGSAVDVFRMNMIDQGVTDGEPTIVTNIRLTPGLSNTADWTNNIQGVTVNNGSPVVIGTPDIQDAYIDIPIPAGNLNIPDDSNLDVTIGVFLNVTGIEDNTVLSFFIDGNNHGFTADNAGSQFAIAFLSGDVSSNNFNVEVSATELQFVQPPTDILINSVMSPAVGVAFTDATGNIDLGFVTEEISIEANTVTLSGSSTTLRDVQVDGVAYFDDLAIRSSGIGTLTATDINEILNSPGPQVTSNTFTVIPILSEIRVVTGSESPGISSLINDFSITTVSEGEQVWQLDLFDGDGVNPDGDGLPTNYTSIRIDQHMSNQIADWSAVILGVGFFEGTTYIPGVITINPTNILFAPSTAFSVPDGAGSKRTLSMRISLQTNLPAGTDGSNFVFEVSEGGVTVESASTSSQLGVFTASSNSSNNEVQVTATKLVFVQQPVDVIQNQEMSVDVTAGFVDANDNIDIHFETEEIALSANSVTLVGGPILGEILSNGLATFSGLTFNSYGTGTLTASDVNDVLGTSETVTSNSFEVFEVAEYLTFVGVPSSGQIDQIIGSFTVEARKTSDGLVDPNYSGDITIAINSGTGNLNGTLTQASTSGAATFNDISFDAAGNFTLLATSGSLTQDISPNIAIVGSDVPVFPNGRETMNFAVTSPSTIAEHEAENGFINTGVLTFSGGGAANESDVRNTSISSGYTNASGGSNVFFTSTTGDYGFAMEDIDASTYSNLTLQFAVHKENAIGTDFASLSVEYWDGDSWEPVSITDFPLNSDGAGWYLLGAVSLPSTAEISNLGLRWVKSGDIACRIDDVSLTGTPKAATNLIVATINGGLPPTVNTPFDVDISVQDGSGSPANVLGDTEVEVILNTGTGVLGGTLTTTILAGTNSGTISGVTYDVSESGVIVTASRTSGDVLQSGNSAAFNVLSSEPFTSASSIVVGTRTLNSIDISWTNGDGTERIVIAKEGGAVDELPADGTTYLPNPDFTLGENIGNGNIVVFAGVGSAVSITNLQPDNTEYHFAVFEYNGSGNLENYKQADPAVANALTICNEPTTQASGLPISNISQSSMDLSWIDGDGSGRIVLMNSVDVFTDPVDGDDTYTADPSWNNAGQQVVYFADGAGTTVTISNLSAASTYYYRVYEYNCSGIDINYKTDAYGTANDDTYLFTQDFTSCPPAGWLNVRIAGDQDWTCGGGYASASGLGSSAPSEIWYITPSINFSATTNAVLTFDSWTTGTDITHPRLEVRYSTDYPGTGNPNLYNWTTLPFNTPAENSALWTPSGIIDLSGITTSAYIAFRYTSSGTAAGTATEWRIDNVAITENGCAAPTTQASNLTFSNIASTSMTLNWDSGNGTGRIVLAKEGSAVDQVPVDLTSYSADPDFTAGQNIGAGNIVVYLGNESSVDISGLLENTEYHVSVFEYNCDAAAPVFNTTSPAIGNQFTIDPDASDIIVDAGFVYPENIAYGTYQAPALKMTPGNSLPVFGLTLRDGGSSGDSDGFPTTLTSISFNANGSTAIKAAGLYYSGAFIATVNSNGSLNDFTFDISGTPIIATDVSTADFQLYVTFMNGSDIIDNEQIVFTVTSAIADPAGTLFTLPDAGGATSIQAPSGTGNENVIRVNSTTLSFVQVPTSTIIVNSPFSIEVEAVDASGTRDLDKTLDVSVIAGTGILSSGIGLQRTTATGTAIWDDLLYNTEENGVQFQVADNPLVLTPITTNLLNAKSGLSVYTFTGAAGDEPDFAPDSQPVNLTIGNISRGSDLVAQTFADAFNARNWNSTSSAADNYFYEFTVMADAGYDFAVSSIELDNRRSGTGPVFWEVRSSVDNFASNIGGIQSTPTEDIWYTNLEVNFGASVTDQTTVTIRIYAYLAGGGLGTWAIDNLYIFGTVRDIQAPEFTAGYPQSDSTAVDGFDLIVNLNEAATVHYVVQPDGGTVPSVSEVLAGQSGGGGTPPSAGTIDVTGPITDFIERIGGLNSASVYDVYYVLSDDTNDSDVIEQADLPTSDINTDLVAATQPVGPFEIPSTSIDAGSAVNVFNFQVSDPGTSDGAPTHITKLVFNAGGSNTVANWATVIGGASLYNTTQMLPINISGVTVNASSLELNILPGDLTIANGATDELALSVWLTTSVTDNEDLEFTIGGDPHTNTTYTIGSQFNSILTTFTSNVYTITVTADRLNIVSYTESVGDASELITLEVEAVDQNGNRDIDDATSVSVLLGQFSQAGGAISPNSPPPTLFETLTSGYFIWNNIQYSIDDDFITLIASSSLIDDTTGIIEVGNPGDLIVTSNTTISSDLQVGNVDIQATGNLTIAPNVTLSVSGNFNVDGIMNGQSGTVNFNDASDLAVQSITGSTSPANFYNITVSNARTFGVISEIDINLHNTLQLNDGTIFDTDGANDDKNFTLISRSGYTARIGAMGVDAQLLGEVIWQRSLRTGPAGYRYIGTPIKGQTLASISDDVWIQGVAERYPSAWTNISTYSEPLGTQGQGGFEGWTDFTSLGNSLVVGRGMKLYQWSIDYAFEQVISMKGAPFIGDGTDVIAGSGESVTLSTSFTSSAYDGGGWNFLANPYPSEIDWNAVIKNGNINGGAVHIWNPSSQQYDTYSSATQTGTNGLTQYVASGQGFFVKADAAGASIELSESTKSSANGNSFLRMSEAPMAKLMVEINASNGSKDQTAVAFADFASDGYDPQFDARKLSAGWVNLSTVLDDKSIAINAMGEKRGVQSVRLNIEPYVYGSYTLKFPSIEAFTEGATVRLVDKYLDKSTYINSTSSYAFSIDEHNAATYGADRFEIQFVEPARFRFDNPDARAGQEFVMPVFADKLEDILSTDMGLSWDSEALTFIGIEDVGIGNMGDFDLSQAEQGRLIFHNENQDPLGLPDGSQLFVIRFRANNGMPQAQLRFDQAYTRLRAINDIDMPFSSEDVLIDILQNRFVAGAITTYSGEFVNEVVVKAENAEETIEHMSDLSGTYKLDTYEQSGYTVSGQKLDNSPLTEAVTTLDIIKTRSHILRKEEFVSPYQWVAADVNDSKSITALDLVEMRKVILGINPAFQSGLDWLIIPEAYDLTDDPFSYQTSMDITLSDQDQDLNFIGVKVGDVDNSWSGQGGARKSKDYLALSMENLVLNDALIEIPVVVSEYNDIRGYQFSITWDPNELAYDGTTSELLEGFFNDQMADNGVLTTMWDERDGRTEVLIAGQTLFTLKFRTLREDAISQVDINSSATQAIAIDEKLNILSIRAVPAHVNLEELRNGKLEMFQNIPNPFEYGTQIDFKITKPGLAIFTIINTLGEIVYIHEENYESGIHSISWDRSQGLRSIAPGMYLYRLESNGEEVVKKMLIK